ncbi:MAG: hypothetical protein K5655_09255 [Lachnospiraceae bacterium]|nr:hypothetical protein [Lachnospiraceae bacterium]
MNEHITEAFLKTAFEKAVGSNEKTFMEYTKPLAEMGRIDYAMLPLDPRWYLRVLMYRYARPRARAPFGEHFVAGDVNVTHNPRPTWSIYSEK